MKIQPLHDQILIEPASGEEKTASGILLPDSAKEKPQKGTVKVLGTGGKDEKGNEIKFPFKVGDTVMYKKWGGSEVKVDGKEMLIVKLEDVLAIVK
ncbi:co-chaperone GroES [candidate division CPR3 bacterium GWF2_35_18]|uniref:Co-chaperonin GroES n=1 Tax=candidate division CPR3 bacterium GW2011_GWF2_35_18 TaxID=1618350 RepID=A0A0G0BZ51_UNCC3|nr:MAG: 10 kDa chaperonin [candidate division CPR3 bacterium GW2011_GWF2_35_18]OGB63846.1 MAG: co-chaperone GroES [candidate division CPR3 bacterium GWF2_35_18]OGB65233.1 MAG: co-chaperone GroES [candidate division CPR3 bacterium RIFOXYA2_FULL_35_13]OGB77251.1 MAG: co-chaperone GroES [candidate division CPR3 bacterium RIFOXYC2_FULL_35_7]OGB79399.1 MAG: co-chaperone GroES [candidate division CPR3 bacterium RIFOXYB2_FULL_35_8]